MGLSVVQINAKRTQNLPVRLRQPVYTHCDSETNLEK